MNRGRGAIKAVKGSREARGKEVEVGEGRRPQGQVGDGMERRWRRRGRSVRDREKLGECTIRAEVETVGRS
jgi:hypothetical protein